MVNKHCCYGVCKSDSRHKDRSYMEGVDWILFPKPSKELEKCRRWVNLCGRPAERFNTEKVTKDTYICSKHFVGGKGPTYEYPDPVPAVASRTEIHFFLKKKSRKAPLKRSETAEERRGVKRRAVEVLEPDPLSLHPAVEQTQTGIDHELPYAENMEPGMPKGQIVAEQSPEKEDLLRGKHAATKGTPKLLRYALLKEPTYFKPETKTVETQTSLSMTGLTKGAVFCELTDVELAGDMKTLKRTLFIADVFYDDQKCKFYTGLTLALFNAVLNLVSRAAKHMDYWRGEKASKGTGRQGGKQRLLTLKEELLLTLVRLRRGFPLEAIADLMGVSKGHVSRVFITWIHLLARKLPKVLIKWPTQLQVRRHLPRAFRHFPRTRCIIDYTEFMLQKPSMPSIQRKSYSNYKHRNTAKCLVAVTPRGSFSFLSDLWTGSISDRKIVERSGFLDLIEPQDDVMADRGFLIRDLLTMRSATLNIPPFALGKQMSDSRHQNETDS